MREIVGVAGPDVGAASAIVRPPRRPPGPRADLAEVPDEARERREVGRRARTSRAPDALEIDGPMFLRNPELMLEVRFWWALLKTKPKV